MWLKAIKSASVPEQLNRDRCTRAQAVKALAASGAALRAALQASIATDGRVRGFKPDVAAFFGYLVAHDAHHRGQMAMLARQTGHPLPQAVTFGMWEWGKC